METIFLPSAKKPCWEEGSKKQNVGHLQKKNGAKSLGIVSSHPVMFHAVQSLEVKKSDKSNFV